MRPSSRAPAWLAACVAGLLASACGPDRARTCAADADCPSDAFCLDGACRAGTSPVARIGVPVDPLTTHRKLVFDGSTSSDADPGDAVTSWAWSIVAVTGGCDPAPATATGSTFETRFDCPGQYQVELVVTDGHGLASAPETLALAVEELPDPPVVTVAPPAELGHQCSGSPLLCTTVDAGGQRPFQLAALATSPAPGGLRYRWTVAAPPGADPKARVGFDPGDDAASPWILVETDGTAIAGTWTFAVEVTDSRNAVAGTTADVVVGNRPPVIVPAGGLVAVAHAFDAAAQQFLSHGETPPAAISDPDGDPIVGHDFARAASGDGGGGFVLTPFPDHAAFDIAVAYGGPADAAHLIGPDVSRSISFTATDVNGGAATATWNVVVTNRPPRVSVEAPAVTVPHWFDQGSATYLAAASLSTFVDDDGDPLAAEAGTGSAICRGESLAAGTVNVLCSVPWVAGDSYLTNLPLLVTTHALTAAVRDPWTSASAPTSLTVTNRPPRLTGESFSIPTACTTGQCCDGECSYYSRGAAAGTGSIATPAVDDDGDPISVAYSWVGSCVNVNPPGAYTCFSGSCPEVSFSLCHVDPACVNLQPATGTFDFSMYDGVDPVLAHFTVSGTCP